MQRRTRGLVRPASADRRASRPRSTADRRRRLRARRAGTRRRPRRLPSSRPTVRTRSRPTPRSNQVPTRRLPRSRPRGRRRPQSEQPAASRTPTSVTRSGDVPPADVPVTPSVVAVALLELPRVSPVRHAGVRVLPQERVVDGAATLVEAAPETGRNPAFVNGVAAVPDEILVVRVAP